MTRSSDNMRRDPFDLDRFIQGQEMNHSYERAIAEIRSGRKTSHWIWYVFPQMAGLGQSELSVKYGIRSLEEARAYLRHPVLRKRLRDAVLEMVAHAGRLTAQDILDPLDAMKLRSCLTLFSAVDQDCVFSEALVYLFGGRPCERTLAIISREMPDACAGPRTAHSPVDPGQSA